MWLTANNKTVHDLCTAEVLSWKMLSECNVHNGGMAPLWFNRCYHDFVEQMFFQAFRIHVQWNSDFSNLQGKWKLVRKIGSSKNQRWHQIRPVLPWNGFIRSKKADNNGIITLVNVWTIFIYQQTVNLKQNESLRANVAKVWAKLEMVKINFPSFFVWSLSFGWK